MESSNITDADFRALMSSYRNAVEDHIKRKFVFAFCPDIEQQVSAPLMARAESKLQASEINLLAAFRRGKDNA